MRVRISLVTALLLVLAQHQSVFSSETAGQTLPFKPYELVGDWSFTNSNTGVHFKGDVKVMLTSVDSSGVMRGKISYDGRQTNDACSTRGVFSDTPIDVEATKTPNEYRLVFSIKCASGESPRRREWTLVCENDVCTRPLVLPHGQGRLALREKR
jgi:hypothetical protein